MCYVVLKENVLAKIYYDGAFMLRASTAYRSLLWRLLENLELITLLERRSASTSCQDQQPSNTILMEASRLASDSRVPKSSSMPARLSNSRPNNTNSVQCSNSNGAQFMRRSRIPLLSARPTIMRRAKSSGATYSNNNNNNNQWSSSRVGDLASAGDRTPPSPRDAPAAGCCLASAIDDFNEPGMLSVSRGERLRILSTRGRLARCCRVRPRHDRVLQGLLPVSILAINGF
ncbi:unnamed protein product [Gongylonema pulchrum]|uniref:RUN domain-containing protein n=1 Tax=Gongylonema pulchrum TaxID=637853 RepID=A0A183D2B8_9BILA|nr:unnamed protein product [Gongylonema pulchrum]